MHTVKAKRPVDIEEVQQVLSDELGSAYQVRALSGSSLKVRRNSVMAATVRLVQSGGMTSFRVSSGGLILFKLMNSQSITPRVIRLLEKAFSDSSAK